MLGSWGSYEQFSTNPDDIAKELVQLRQEFGGAKSLVSGWSRGGGPDINVSYLESDHVRFSYNPCGYFNLISTVAQSIPNNAGTAVSFDTLNLLGDTPATWSSNASSAISILGRPLEHGYLVAGILTWASNTSGRRAVVFQRNFGGSSVHGNTLISEAASSTHHSQSFVFPWRVQNSSATGDPTVESRLIVVQDSGGALNLDFASLLITRLY